MDQLTQDAAVAMRIDHDLDYLIREWRNIPLLADEWDDWDDHSQLIFVLNWAVPNDRLGELRKQADQGLLNAEQQARYDELQQIIAQHEPWLERILAE